MVRSMIRLTLVFFALLAGLAAGMALLKRAIPSVGDENSDEIRLAAIGEARALKSRATAFRGGSSLSVMGATKIDLRNATVAPGGARIQVQVIMSALKVLVPESWLVRTDVEGPGSAVENRTARAGEETDAAPDLVLTGTAVASAVAVAHKAEEPAGVSVEVRPAGEGVPA
jgi:hypothetical protein